MGGGAKIAIKPTRRRMNYYDEPHIYRKDGIEYLSITKFLKRFKPEFPKALLAEKCSVKEGLSPAEVIYKWDLNGEVSANYGTSIHKGIEYWIRFGVMPKVPHVVKAIEAFAEKYKREELEPEVIVYSKELKLAGTIDQIRRIKKGTVQILDVKTNGEITDKARGKFLAPLDDLPYSKLNEYRLQLSAYKELLELKGIEVEEIVLEHFDGEKFKTIKLEPIKLTNIWKTLN